MYKDAVVVDTVVHAFNRTPENERNDYAREFTSGTYQRHKFAPKQYQLTEDEWRSDVQSDELARTVFQESDVDYAYFQSLPLTDYYKDGHVALDKGVEFREDNPDRSGLLAAINPLRDDAIEHLEYLVNDLEVDGLKIYPARFEDGESLAVWLNDPDGAQPVVEHAIDLGVEHIAVHKSIPTRLTHQRYFELDDVEEAAASYPELSFHIVHAGFSFLEETVSVLTRYDNVYANLETTMMMMIAQPRAFAESIGEMMLWAGPEKLMFGSGCTAYHPQLLIEEFWDFQIPKDLRKEYNYPKITKEDKKKILGLNACDVFGLDPETIRENAQKGQWAEAQESEGKAEPWSSLRA